MLNSMKHSWMLGCALSCVVVFIIGIAVGTLWQMPKAEHLPDQPQPIPEITPMTSPVGSPEPVSCTTDVLVCADGSVSTRNPYDNCTFLLCSHPDGRPADTLEIAREFFSKVGAQDKLVESVTVAHHLDDNYGHIYQAIVLPVHVSNMDALQKMIESELARKQYSISAAGRVKTEEGETVHYEKHDPLYHGFRLDRHTSSYVINFWWD